MLLSLTIVINKIPFEDGLETMMLAFDGSIIIQCLLIILMIIKKMIRVFIFMQNNQIMQYRM